MKELIMSSEEHKQKYINRIKEVVNPMIYKEIDGYDVIQFTGSGFWTAESLRVIADYLDERNKPWDYIINEGICHQCGKAKAMSREMTENGDPIFYDCHYCTSAN